MAAFREMPIDDRHHSTSLLDLAAVRAPNSNPDMVKEVTRTHGLGLVRLTKGNIGAGAQFADDDSRVSYSRRGVLLLPRHGRLLERPSRDLLGGGAGVASGNAGGRGPAGRAAHGERPRQYHPANRRSDAA